MKIVLWIGNESNQIALARKISDLYPIDTIILESKKKRRRVTFGLLIQKIIEKLFLSEISKSWFGMLSFYKKNSIELISANVIHTENINSDDIYRKTKDINPDLIIVSGTRLIKDKLLSLNPKIGTLNLHTGLSPYIKGGPNCTNWCIAAQQFHLIGNTIMWIDKGIDSGRIIASELTPFNGDEHLLEVHIKVMEHAHELYLKAIINISIGSDIKGISQNDIINGKTYYSKDWNLNKKFKLKKNFKSFKNIINSKEYIEKQKSLKTIGIK